MHTKLLWNNLLEKATCETVREVGGKMKMDLGFKAKETATVSLVQLPAFILSMLKLQDLIPQRSSLYCSFSDQ
jgi:hypothetical protein